MRNSTARSATRFRWTGTAGAGSVPRRLAEFGAAGQYGGHRAAGLMQRSLGPAAGLPVADQRVQRRWQDSGLGAGRGRDARACLRAPGGTGGQLAGPARPGRADRLVPPAPGAGPGRVGSAETPAGPAQPAGQPGQIPAVGAGPGDLRVRTAGGSTTRGRRARACFLRARAARAAS